jgi:hypothetical protein
LVEANLGFGVISAISAVNQIKIFNNTFTVGNITPMYQELVVVVVVVAVVAVVVVVVVEVSVINRESWLMLVVLNKIVMMRIGSLQSHLHLDHLVAVVGVVVIKDAVVWVTDAIVVTEAVAVLVTDAVVVTDAVAVLVTKAGTMSRKGSEQPHLHLHYLLKAVLGMFAIGTH